MPNFISFHKGLFFSLLWLILPLHAGTYATKFIVADHEGLPLSGRAELHGAVDVSFAVTSALGNGLSLSVAPDLIPADVVDNSKTHVFRFHIYEDFAYRTTLTIDAAFARVDVSGPTVVPMGSGKAVLPFAFVPGKRYTLCGGPGIGTKPVNGLDYSMLLWDFVSEPFHRETAQIRAAHNMPPSAVRAYTFYHGPIDNIRLDWLRDGPDYAPWSPAGQTVPADSIAINHEGTIPIDIAQESGIPLSHIEATLYHDSDAVFNGNEEQVRAKTWALHGQPSFSIPLADLIRGTNKEDVDGFYWLDIRLENIYGGSRSLAQGGEPIPIASLRALAFPQRLSWSVNFPSSTLERRRCSDRHLLFTYNPCLVGGIQTNREGRSEQHIRYASPDNCECDYGSQTVEVFIAGFYNAQNQLVRFTEEMGWMPEVALLAGEGLNCDISRNVLISPDQVDFEADGLKYTFLDFERFNKTQRRKWQTLDQGGGLVRGAESGTPRFVDLRSGQAVGETLFTAAQWLAAPPKHNLILNAFAVDQDLCETTVAIALSDSRGNEINEHTYDYDTDNLVRHAYRYNDQYSSLIPTRVRVTAWYYADNGAGAYRPVPSSVLWVDGDIDQIPIQGAAYPCTFEVLNPSALPGDFYLQFSAYAGVSRLAEETLTVRHTPSDPGGGTGGGTTPSLTGLTGHNLTPAVAGNGAVSMSFEIGHDVAPPDHLAWRWQGETEPGVLQYWNESGYWQTDSVPYMDLGNPTSGSFSSHWQHDSAAGMIRWINGDFANYTLPFFGQFGASRTVILQLYAVWDDGTSQSLESLPMILEREVPAGNISHFLVRLGDEGGGHARLNYRTQEADQLQWLVYSAPGTPINLANLSLLLDGQEISQIRKEVDGSWIRLYLEPGQAPAGLKSHGAKTVTARLGDGSFQSLDLYARSPENSLTIRFHFRDHLGTSVLTQSRRSQPSHPGAQADDLSVTTSSGSPLFLFDHGTTASYFSPFGISLEREAVNLDDIRARYTDHERDPTTGMTYMKGRYHLSEFAVFTRPDPMRDWDWENPNSLNLYQYVRNDPINSSDPTGLFDAGPAGVAYYVARASGAAVTVATTTAAGGATAATAAGGGTAAAAAGTVAAAGTATIVGAVAAGGVIGWFGAKALGADKLGAYLGSKLYDAVHSDAQQEALPETAIEVTDPQSGESSEWVGFN